MIVLGAPTDKRSDTIAVRSGTVKWWLTSPSRPGRVALTR
jgi:hypothetical protein